MCVFRAIKRGSFLYKRSGSASFTVLECLRLLGELQAAVVPLSQSCPASPIPPFSANQGKVLQLEAKLFYSCSCILPERLQL